MRILHLSDTHLVAAGGRPDDALVAQLAELRHVAALDLVVVSGDCSDDGSPASYARLRALVEPWAAERGAAVVYAMGNHDERAGFAQVLGDGVGGPSDGCGPLGGVRLVGDVRVVVLDSSRPGHSHGVLTDEQLAWLRGELSAPAAAGTVVVVHHPPVPSVTPLHAGIELQNPAALAATLADSDVELILSGHYHHQLQDSLVVAGRRVPVVVTPGVVSLNDVVAAPGWERATCGRGATLIELTERGPRVQVLQTSSPEEVFAMPPRTVADVAARING